MVAINSDNAQPIRPFAHGQPHATAEELALLESHPIIVAEREKRKQAVGAERRAKVEQIGRIHAEVAKQTPIYVEKLKQATAEDLAAYHAWNEAVIALQRLDQEAQSFSYTRARDIAMLQIELRGSADQRITTFLDQISSLWQSAFNGHFVKLGDERSTDRRSFGSTELQTKVMAALERARLAALELQLLPNGHDAGPALEQIRATLIKDVAEAERPAKPSPAIAPPTNQTTGGPHSAHQEL